VTTGESRSSNGKGKWPQQAASLGLLGMLLTLSCARVPRTQYYTLANPSPPSLSDPKTNFVLGVERLRAPERLRDDRIVYFESPTQMNYYQYSRWGADPSTMLSEFVIEWLNGLGTFTQVRILPAREAVDYVLRGRLFNFEEVDFKGESKGRVGLELVLIRSHDHKLVWSARRQTETPIQEKGIAGVVNALNVSSNQLLRDMIPGLVTQVEQDYKATQGQSP
jgi:ABC-type uncharacterized transport system auxiliary subunit